MTRPTPVVAAGSVEPWRAAAMKAHVSWAARQSRCPDQSADCRRPGCVHTVEVDRAKLKALSPAAAARSAEAAEAKERAVGLDDFFAPAIRAES